MAGEIQLGGTSFASELSGTITVNNGTIGSGVVFPAGHVIQVSTNNFNTQPTRASSSFGAFSTPVTATINNCITGNKILIILSIYCSNSVTQYFNLRLVDTTNSNAVIGTEGTDGLMGRVQGGSTNEIYVLSNSILYTPASFSSGSLTVELYGKTDGGTLYLNRNSGGGSNISSSITLMEIQS